METKVCVGIDISKDSFDVALPVNGKAGYQYSKFSNTAAGFKKLYAHLAPESHCVMEASGIYYLPLAAYLHQARKCGEPLNHQTLCSDAADASQDR